MRGANYRAPVYVRPDVGSGGYTTAPCHGYILQPIRAAEGPAMKHEAAPPVPLGTPEERAEKAAELRAELPPETAEKLLQAGRRQLADYRNQLSQHDDGLGFSSLAKGALQHASGANQSTRTPPAQRTLRCRCRTRVQIRQRSNTRAHALGFAAVATPLRQRLNRESLSRHWNSITSRHQRPSPPPRLESPDRAHTTRATYTHTRTQRTRTHATCAVFQTRPSW